MNGCRLHVYMFTNKQIYCVSLANVTMSQKEKFATPFKDPLEHRALTKTNITTPKSGKRLIAIIDGKITSARKVKTTRLCRDNSRSPKTPTQRTPTFSLYGIKSPYRRSYKELGRRSRLSSTQISTPGQTPGKLIKNFKKKMGENAEQTFSENESIPLEGHCLEKNRQESANEYRYNKSPNQCSPELTMHKPDVYKLDVSSDPRFKKTKHGRQEKVKENVLKVIAKMQNEIGEFRRRHQKLLQSCETENRGFSVESSTSNRKNFAIELVIDSQFSISSTQHTADAKKQKGWHSDQQYLTVTYKQATQEDSPLFEPMEE